MVLLGAALKKARVEGGAEHKAEQQPENCNEIGVMCHYHNGIQGVLGELPPNFHNQNMLRYMLFEQWQRHFSNGETQLIRLM